jgi:hypothetical protein
MKSIQIDNRFSKNYEYQILTEIPNGNYPHFYYPGGQKNGGKDGILVKVIPNDAKEWIGTFAKGSISSNSLNCILSWINPDKICIVSLGTGFVVDVNFPEKYHELDIDPIFYAGSILERKLVIFASYTYISAYNNEGLCWETERISFDDLQISGIDDSFVRGTYFDSRSNDWSKFKVDLSNGKVYGGISNSL